MRAMDSSLSCFIANFWSRSIVPIAIMRSQAHSLALLLTFAQVALDQEQAKDAEAKAEARRKFNESQAKMRAQVVVDLVFDEML